MACADLSFPLEWTVLVFIPVCPYISKAIRGKEGRDRKCAATHHAALDPHALGKLRVTPQIDAKKNYKWFIEKLLQLFSIFSIT